MSYNIIFISFYKQFNRDVRNFIAMNLSAQKYHFALLLSRTSGCKKRENSFSRNSFLLASYLAHVSVMFTIKLQSNVDLCSYIVSEALTCLICEVQQYAHGSRPFQKLDVNLSMVIYFIDQIGKRKKRVGFLMLLSRKYTDSSSVSKRKFEYRSGALQRLMVSASLT